MVRSLDFKYNRQPVGGLSLETHNLNYLKKTVSLWTTDRG